MLQTILTGSRHAQMSFGAEAFGCSIYHFENTDGQKMHFLYSHRAFHLCVLLFVYK